MASADVDITARPYVQDPSALDPHGPLPGGNAGPPTRDDLDDLFNYDPNIGDTFQDVDADNDAARTTARRRDLDVADADLGIDEEIKVRKARKPVAKLDEERLLSQNGIPKLRRISKTKLKFRGKGHEFSDVQRLLNTYQLWLDDLFPKAKFADGLAIIEKLGHKKRLKVMRQEWINEEKPKPEVHDISDDDGDFTMLEAAAGVSGAVSEDSREGQETESSRLKEVRRESDQASSAGDQDNGLDDETLYGRPDVRKPATAERIQQAGEPDEDELDQLMAEDAAKTVPETSAQPDRDADFEDFADEEEAMAGLW